MSADTTGSRRAFMVGGVAVAACAGPLALAAAGSSNRSLGSIIPGIAPIAPETTQWQNQVGNTFTLTGESGSFPAKLSAVVVDPVDATRPRSLARPRSFIAFFEMPARVAPAGQLTYQVSNPVLGTMKLFLGRSEDKRGVTVMSAVFN